MTQKRNGKEIALGGRETIYSHGLADVFNLSDQQIFAHAEKTVFDRLYKQAIEASEKLPDNERLTFIAGELRAAGHVRAANCLIQMPAIIKIAREGKYTALSIMTMSEKQRSKILYNV